MKKTLLTLFWACTVISCNAQALASHRPQIDAAKDSLGPVFNEFASCILTHDIDHCAIEMVKKASDPYRQYLVAGLLFQFDTAVSFDLHKKAYLALPDDENFLLEYAIELHRKGQYEEASKLYERYEAKFPGDYHVHTWLADCYINLGLIDKSIAEWAKADHAGNHTGIDMAINTIYGKTDLMKKRDAYRSEIAAGKTASIYPLIFHDTNWEYDPWNKVVQSDFLEADMDLAAQKLGKTSDAYKKLNAYVRIKKLTAQAPATDSVKQILKDAGIMLDGKAIPEYGAIASDLLRICAMNKLIDVKAFYKSRGEEILRMAKANKDAEMLNVYAYLQVSAQGSVDPAIDKMGWKELHDERFAVSYFIGKAERNRYDDPELAQAMADFPWSAELVWVKANCAKMESKPLRAILIDVIKKEFKVLESTPDHYSYGLNTYFGFLAEQKK